MKVNFTELLDLLDDSDMTAILPYDEYDIIGDKTEIDNIITTAGYINIDVGDIMKILSKETSNYVISGFAEGTDSVANALKDAFSKLPIATERISKQLFNIWTPKAMQASMNVINSLWDFIAELPTDIDVIIWGCAFDESMERHQAKVSLIASSK